MELQRKTTKRPLQNREGSVHPALRLKRKRKHFARYESFPISEAINLLDLEIGPVELETSSRVTLSLHRMDITRWIGHYSSLSVEQNPRSYEDLINAIGQQ